LQTSQKLSKQELADLFKQTEHGKENQDTFLSHFLFDIYRTNEKSRRSNSNITKSL